MLLIQLSMHFVSVHPSSHPPTRTSSNFLVQSGSSATFYPANTRPLDPKWRPKYCQTQLQPEVEKYFIFCQPDKKIENFLPHSRNFKWGLWIYICRNHIIYINLDTFTTIMSIFTSYFIKLMDYTQTISIF